MRAQRLDDAALLHLEVEVVPLAGALAHAAEDRLAAVALGHVVDQLHDHDGLADAGAAEEADLAALHERGDQVDDLDAGLEDLGLGLEVGELRRLAVDRPALRVRPGSAAPPSTGSPSTLRMRPSAASPTGTVIAAAGVGHLHAAGDAVGRAHGHRAHLVLADVLLHLGGEADRHGARGVLDGEGVVDLRQVLGLELDVEHRADDLDDAADVLLGLRRGAGLLGCDSSGHELISVVSVTSPERCEGAMT